MFQMGATQFPREGPWHHRGHVFPCVACHTCTVRNAPAPSGGQGGRVILEVSCTGGRERARLEIVVQETTCGLQQMWMDFIAHWAVVVDREACRLGRGGQRLVMAQSWHLGCSDKSIRYAQSIQATLAEPGEYSGLCPI